MNLDSLRDQDQAVTVACRHCGAPIGEYCIRADGYPLTNFAAHLDRLRDSGVTHAPLDPRELRRAD